MSATLSDAGTPSTATPAAAPPRAKAAGRRFRRWHLDTQAPAEEEGWLLTYLDVITLMLVMMVVMLSLAGPPDSAPTPEPTAQAAAAATATASAANEAPAVIPLPVLSPEVSPRQESPAQGLPPLKLGQDVDVSEDANAVRFRLSSEFLFSPGGAELTQAGYPVLDELIPVLNADPTLRLVIEGHTDNTPIQQRPLPVQLGALHQPRRCRGALPGRARRGAAAHPGLGLCRHPAHRRQRQPGGPPRQPAGRSGDGKSAGCNCAALNSTRIRQPRSASGPIHCGHEQRAVLADEIRAQRVLDRRRAQRPQRHRALDRRAQLPGAQLHARSHAGGRRRAVLPLQLPATGHRRHRRGGVHHPARPDAVRPGLALFRPQVPTRAAALAAARREGAAARPACWACPNCAPRANWPRCCCSSGETGCPSRR